MKNKLVLVTAIAAAFAPLAAMSEASIYGTLSYSVNSVDAGAGSTLSGNDNVSLFGLKASSEGDGVKAFIHLQTGAPSDVNATSAFTQRFFFGGLSGDFGQVAYGRMTNAYKFDGFALDPFYNLSHIGATGTFSAGGATYGLSTATNGFTDNAIQYTSPSINGLKVNAGLYIDDTAADDHGMGIGVAYSAGNFNVGLQLASNDTATVTIPGVIADGDAMRLYGGYKADGWSAAFSYENVDLTPTTDANYMYLVGRYNVTPKTEAVLTLGSVSDGAAEGSGFTGGVFQTVAPKVQVYASYSTASLDTGLDPSVFSVGALHKF